VPAHHVHAVHSGAVNEPRLLGARDHARPDAGLLDDAREELRAVLGLAHGARRRGEDFVHAVRLGDAPEFGERQKRGAHRLLGQAAPVEAAGPQPHHLLLAVDYLERQIGADANHDHVDRVRADVDGGEAHWGAIGPTVLAEAGTDV
jgi:hypothetical protein